MWPQGIMGRVVPGFEKSRTFFTYLPPRILSYAGDMQTSLKWTFVILDLGGTFFSRHGQDGNVARFDYCNPP